MDSGPPDLQAEQARRLFDAKAATWAAKYRPDGRLAGRRRQFAAELGSRLAEGSRVLDLGCGTGDLARQLAAAGFRATGCDIAPEMLRRAAAADRRGTVTWTSLESGWQQLPWETATFDAVIAASVLEYTRAPGLILRECARVLRLGGFLICTVPDPAHPIRWVEAAARLACRCPGMPIAAKRWSRLDQYLTYLGTSTQRHPVHWWYEAAQRAGLWSAAAPPGSPLRLLIFQRRSEIPAEVRIRA